MQFVSSDQLLFQMLKGGVDKRVRDAMGGSIAASLRSANKKIRSSGPLTAEAAPALASLRDIGFAQIGPLFTPDQIERIHGYFAARPAMFYNANVTDADVVRCSLGGRPAGYRFCEWSQDVISACPEFQAAAHHPTLLRLAEEYLEAPPTITILTTWWSFPSDGPLGGMQNFHHDRDDFRCLKLFVYLTPVTAQTGPHEYVDGTHTLDAIIRLAAPEQLHRTHLQKFLGWLEVHRKDEQDVVAAFPGGRIRTILGESGSTFLEDTRGFHRGVPPRAAPRFAFEICYSLLPKYNAKYEPIVRTMAVDPAVAYATRLFYRAVPQ